MYVCPNVKEAISHIPAFNPLDIQISRTRGSKDPYDGQFRVSEVIKGRALDHPRKQV